MGNKKKDPVFIDSLIEGYVLLIPLIFISVICTLLLNFPVGAYLEWLQNGGAALRELLSIINGAVWDWFGVYIVVAVAWSYTGHISITQYQRIIMTFVSLISFLILIGVGTEGFQMRYLSNQGTFTAVFALFTSCTLYRFVSERTEHLFQDYRISRLLSASLRNALPLFAVLFSCLLFSFVLGKIAPVQTLQELVSGALSEPVIRLYKFSPLFAALLYEFFCMGAWFFGVHGQNLLFTINDGFYRDLLQQNISGADNIINTTFLNVFCMIGGSGCLLALILVILKSSKNLTARTVAKIGALPGLFNMSEVLAFGLPIAFNKKLVVPFVGTPMVNCLLAYIATAIGLVPVTSREVNWTTPVFFNGYLATGSIKGAVFQAVLLVIDIAIYIPFVRQYDDHEDEKLIDTANELTQLLIECENEVRDITLTQIPGRLGETARSLAFDLRFDLQEKKLYMLYQPQYTKREDYMGAEALLRWEHPVVGFIYPPMIIKLAMESGFLYELEEFVFDSTCRGIRILEDIGGIPCKVSANITGASAVNPNFVEMVDGAVERHGINPEDLWIELTEQAVMTTSRAALKRLSVVREHGHKLLIDDFSMGHTSISYLKTDMFDGVKLDGKITRHVMTDEKDRQIIASVAKMCEDMGMLLIAEFVEDEDQKEMLKALGGDAFQGYLYSKPLSIPDMVELVERKTQEKMEKDR